MEHENEYALAARYPRLPLIVEEMDYPETIQALIDDVNEKFGLWAEAESEFMEAQQDLAESRAKDAAAFKDSVLSGTKDPGKFHEPKAARNVERTQILMAARLAEVNRAGSTLQDAYRREAKAIVQAAIAMARDGVNGHEASVLEAGRILEAASERRFKKLRGLVQASELTASVYRFDPIFPMVKDVVMPDLREVRVNEVCDKIESWIEKGVLFPDPKE